MAKRTLSVYWRVFAVNVGLLGVVALLLVVTPVTISAPIKLEQALIVAVGLVVALAANAWLLRRAVAPLERLAQRMETVDLLRRGQRLEVRRSDEIGRVVSSFNRMLERLEGEIHILAGRPFNIASVKQLRGILFDELGFKPSHRTAITKAASTDQETLEDLARQGHELPKKLLEQRKIAKLRSTYVDALPTLVHPQTGRVHTSFNQTVAAEPVPDPDSEADPDS